MQLHIMGYQEAQKFVPEVRTAAIRIYGSTRDDNMGYGRLNLKGNWVGEKRVIFDHLRDMSAGQLEAAAVREAVAREAFFSSAKAESVIKWVREVIDERNPEAILVHCRAGLNRSPAIAMALNRIFKFGLDQDEMMRDYPYHMVGAYEQMLFAAERMGLIKL